MGANSRRRRAEKVRRWERQREVRVPRLSTADRSEEDAFRSALGVELGRLIETSVSLLRASGIDDVEIVGHLEPTLHDLPPAVMRCMAAAVSARAIGLLATLVSAGWDSIDLDELFCWYDARFGTFVNDVLQVTPVMTFTADDVLVGLRLLAVLEAETSGGVSTSGAKELVSHA